MRIGVDLGGTKTEAIALDGAGRELRRVRVPTPQGDYAATVHNIASLVTDLERELGEQGTVGVGIPGTIVASTGLVKNANSTWLNGQPLQRDLSDALNREVRCANDANCFAISEATDGAAVGADVVFGVILGTGCGGGLVVRGSLLTGPNGLSGEWGHTALPWPTADEWPGPECYCGRRGCLETWISGTGFERDFERVSGRSLRGAEIVAAAASGDPEAASALDRLEDRIARGLSTVVDIVDADMIVLGGGLSRIERLYAGGIASRLRDYGFGGGVTTPIRRNLHGDSSGVRGAAWLWPAPDPHLAHHPQSSGGEHGRVERESNRSR
jgi:fructokinase